MSTVSRANVQSHDADDRMARIEALMAAQIGMVDKLISAVVALAPAKPARPALEAPRSLAPRDELRMLVNRGAESCGGYQEAWHQLYEQDYYRNHRNIRQAAKNRGANTLDYAEWEGILDELVILARYLFGEAA